MSRAWLALCLRICCVLFLCAAYLSTHGDCRAHGFVARGLIDVPASDGAGSLCYDVRQIENDVILPGGRDNDPFLFLLSLRASFVPCPNFFVKSDHLLSEMGPPYVRVAPPDTLPHHLYLLAKSTQLLC